MALSVLGSMGLCSFFGVKSTLIIVEVIPFLVLAVCDIQFPFLDYSYVRTYIRSHFFVNLDG